MSQDNIKEPMLDLRRIDSINNMTLSFVDDRIRIHLNTEVAFLSYLGPRIMAWDGIWRNLNANAINMINAIQQHVTE